MHISRLTNEKLTRDRRRTLMLSGFVATATASVAAAAVPESSMCFARAARLEHLRRRLFSNRFAFYTLHTQSHVHYMHTQLVEQARGISRAATGDHGSADTALTRSRQRLSAAPSDAAEATEPPKGDCYSDVSHRFSSYRCR